MDKALLKKEYRRLLVQAIEGRSGGAYWKKWTSTIHPPAQSTI